MMSFLLATLVFTANQGSAVQVKVLDEPHVKTVQVLWRDKKVPAFRTGETWTTILGVDLDSKPGEQRAEALLTTDDGEVKRRELTVEVLGRKFAVSRLNVKEQFVELSRADLNRADAESRELATIYERITTDVVPDEPFSDPIPGESGTNFGERRIFNGEPRAPHSGADLHAAIGTPVHATNRGRVALAKNLFFTGNTVVLDHGFGIISVYAHLSQIDVKPGEMVKNGQVIGLSGETGRVTAPHLHWGMRVQGARRPVFARQRVEVGVMRVSANAANRNWAALEYAREAHRSPGTDLA